MGKLTFTKEFSVSSSFLGRDKHLYFLSVKSSSKSEDRYPRSWHSLLSSSNSIVIQMLGFLHRRKWRCRPANYLPPSAPSGLRVARPFLGCVSHYPFTVIYILKSLSCCIEVLMGGVGQLHQAISLASENLLQIIQKNLSHGDPNLSDYLFLTDARVICLDFYFLLLSFG